MDDEEDRGIALRPQTMPVPYMLLCLLKASDTFEPSACVTQGYLGEAC